GIVVNGTTYDASNPTGTEVITNVGPNNCDSTVTINLNVLPVKTGTVSNTICFEDAGIVVNGTTYDASNPTGTEVITNVGPNNCDSTVTINLNVLPVKTGTVSNTICFEDAGIVVNGTTYDASNPTGTEVITNVGPNNCDSTVTINLNVLPVKTGTVSNTICFEDAGIVVNGTTYDASNPTGTEVITNVGPNNCDSTVTINLNVLPVKTGTVSNTICSYESVLVNGTTYDASNPTGTEVITNVGPNNCDSTVTVNLTITPDPVIGITTASECENVPGSGEALNIDVTGLDAAIHGTGTVVWYTDNTYTTTFNPTNETVSNGEVFYFELTSNSCTVQGSVTYNVSGNIVLNDPMPELCEDVAGGGIAAGIDLTTYNNAVFAGASSYTWATGPTGVTINDGDSINIQVQQGSCPTVDIFVHFTVNPLPTSNPSSMELCEDAAGSGQASFDLTTLNTAVNGGSGNVTWFTDAGTSSSIGTPSAYVTGSTTVYALVTDATTSCTDTAAVVLTVNSLPNSNPSAMEMCDEGGNQATFDLTSLDNTINGGTSDVVTWFTDAATSGSIGTPGAYVTGSTTVYALVTDGTTSCTDTAAVVLTVNPLPTVANTTINLCDDGSGQASFDLTSVDNTVNGGTANVVTWFDDALATSPIGTPGAYVTGNDTVYAVVTDGTTLCMDTTDVYLIIDPLPVANDQTPQLCEDASTPGTVAGVDLTLLNGSIDGGAGSTLTWYTDAGLVTPVGTPTNTTVNDNDVFYVLVDNGTCSDTAMVTYTVTSTISLTDPSPVLCEDTFGSGNVTNIDLTSYNTAVYSGAGATYTWYTDAGLLTPVGTPTNVTASNGTIFYVDVVDGTCNNNTTLTFTVNGQSVGTVDSTICNGGSVTVNGTVYSSATTLTGVEIFTSANNCDSTVTVTITELPLITSTLDSTVCNGGSFVFNGTTYDAANP
ncbi:beta strand repeat-containing protein, partial [Vicingus serpentipes]|uniref:beta strand repeat-containing protein n=1 Tax=Vicingus serpentipes TaxID=1926625 RepID=UPI001476AE50